MKFNQFLGICGIAAVVGLAACEPKVVITPVEADTAEKANIMTVNAAPDPKGVDLFVKELKYATNILFGGNTSYMAIPRSETMKFNVASSSSTVLNVQSNFAKGKNYSVFMCGDSTKTEAVISEDVFTVSDVDSFETEIRIVNLSPDGMPVTVEMQDSASTVQPTLAAGVAYKQVSAFKKYKGCKHTITISAPNNPNDIPITLYNVSLKSGSISTIYVKGYTNAAYDPTNPNRRSARIITNRVSKL